MVACLFGLLLAAQIPSAIAKAVQPEVLTLESAINLALQRNHSLASDALGVAAMELGVQDAEHAFALQVRPEINAGLVGEERLTGYALNAAQRFVTGTVVELRAERTHGSSIDDTAVDFTRLTLGISQPLFRNAGQLVNAAAIRGAESGWLRSRRLHELRKADLVIAVVRAYHDVFQLERQLLADEQALRRSRAHHQLAHAGELAGRVGRVDALRAELQAGQAESRLQIDRERLAVSRHNLAELLGLPREAGFELAPTLDSPGYAIPDARDAVAIALENRLEYAQARADFADAGRHERIAQRQLLPDLEVFASYTAFTDPLSPAEQDLFNDGGVFVGVRGGFDVDRTRDRNAARRAQLGTAVAVENLRGMELAIARDVQQAVLAYRSARAEADIAGRNLALADTRQRLARRLFTLGRSSSFEVTDAESAYLAAETAVLAAHTAQSVRAYELARSLGTLIDPAPELRATYAGISP